MLVITFLELAINFTSGWITIGSLLFLTDDPEQDLDQERSLFYMEWDQAKILRFDFAWVHLFWRQ